MERGQALDCSRLRTLLFNKRHFELCWKPFGVSTHSLQPFTVGNRKQDGWKNIKKNPYIYFKNKRLHTIMFGGAYLFIKAQLHYGSFSEYIFSFFFYFFKKLLHWLVRASYYHFLSFWNYNYCNWGGRWFECHTPNGATWTQLVGWILCNRKTWQDFSKLNRFMYLPIKLGIWSIKPQLVLNI